MVLFRARLRYLFVYFATFCLEFAYSCICLFAVYYMHLFIHLRIFLFLLAVYSCRTSTAYSAKVYMTIQLGFNMGTIEAIIIPGGIGARHRSPASLL